LIQSLRQRVNIIIPQLGLESNTEASTHTLELRSSVCVLQHECKSAVNAREIGVLWLTVCA